MFGLSKPQSKDKGAKLAQVQNQAPDTIPGMFKPGEFVLPPDTVHAMGGKQALQGVVDATHTPVTPAGAHAPGLGLKVPQPQPEVFFANGGAPEDQLAKRAMGPGNTFPQSSPSAGANIYAGAGLSRDQFGSSGKFVQVPASMGQQPARQTPVVAQAPAAAAVPSTPPTPTTGPAPATRTAPAQPQVAPTPAPSAAPSSSNIFPGNRLQGDSGFSGAPAVQDPAVKLKAIADMNSRGESYGSNAPSNASFGLKPSNPSAAPSQVATPAQPAATRVPGASELYMQDRAQEMDDQWKAGNYAQAIGTAGRTAVQGLGMYGLELADKTLTPVGNAMSNFAGGLFGLNDAQAAPVPAAGSAPKPAVTPAVTPAAPAPSASGGAATTALQPGLTNNVGTAPAGTTAASASQAGELPAGVYNHGRGQYSDSAAGMGLPAGFTGKPNAQNDAAAGALAQSEAGGFGLKHPVQPEAGGFGLNAPTVTHSGNDWAARNNLRNLEVSASSITNRPEWRSGSTTTGWNGRSSNPGQADPDGKIGRFNAAMQADLAAQGKQPDMQLKTNEINAGLKRTAMSEAGANQRATLGEAGANARAGGQIGLGLQRLSLDQQRAKSDDRLRAPQIKAAERLGQLQDAYVSAKTPEEQAAIATQIRAYSGKEDADWKVQVTPATKNVDGSTTAGSVIRYNSRTGDVQDVGGVGGKASAGVVITDDAAGRTAFAQLPSGATYTGPDGKQYKKN
ncbi:hypothetical protein [Comamonas fluminis]|uniref:hypothetical protein n=1 Tax=Comamonas fluminis TaxID=2796366 RepID=UPI001C44613A|nr:hypothetical protein [Comamonas fluminis]